MIESPSLQDLNNKRYEGDILERTLPLMGIDCVHKLAVDVETFEHSLVDGLSSWMDKTDSVPILHLSCHGNRDGIILTDGSQFDWTTIKKILIPLNEALNGILILCMSSCDGFSAVRIPIRSVKDPFFALVGPNGEAEWSETAVAFITFYHQLSRNITVDEAVDAMNIASGNNVFVSIIEGAARKMFLEEVQKYKNHLGSIGK